MAIAFEVATLLPAPPEAVYSAWLDSEQHTAMTGGYAEIFPGPGARYTVWNGYLWGRTLELEPGRRIVQSWRSLDFDEEDQDSRLEVQLDNVSSGGTLITIRHSNLPPAGLGYRQGWIDHYFTPMERYFSNGWKSA